MILAKIMVLFRRLAPDGLVNYTRKGVVFKADAGWTPAAGGGKSKETTHFRNPGCPKYILDTDWVGLQASPLERCAKLWPEKLKFW